MGFTKKITESASFRKKIVYEYNNLNKEMVYQTLDETLTQYTKYCNLILNYIENYEKNTPY